MTKSKKYPLPAINTCSFVNFSDVHNNELSVTLWDKIIADAPFTWGDNNRSMITASYLLDYINDCIGDNKRRKGVARILSILEDLGETYVDLEN